MYCRHCGVELLDWAKVCIMCGAPTDDATPEPVVIDNEDATTVLSGRFAGVEDDATRIVDRTRRDRINVSVPKPTASQDVADPLAPEEDMKTTQINTNHASASASSDSGNVAGFEYDAPTSVLNMPPAVDKDEFADDDTGLFVNPEDDNSRVYTEDALAHTDEAAAAHSIEESGEEGPAWDSMQSASNRAKKQAKPKSKATTVLGICLAVVGVISLGVLAFVLFGPSNSSSWMPVGSGSGSVAQASANGLKVAIPVSIPSLDAKGSRIPVHVSGQTESGVAVDQDTYIGHDGNGLTLESGTYDVRAVGSPISADGVIYTIPDKSITVSFVDGLVFTKNSGEKLTFKEIAAADTTISQINAAYEWVAKDPERSDRASDLLDAARTRRAEAVAAIEKEKAAQQKQQETERQQVVNTDYDTTQAQQQQQQQQQTDSTDDSSGDDDSGSTGEGDDSGETGGDDSGDAGEGGDDSGGGDSGGGDTGGGDTGGGDSGGGDSGGGDSGGGDSGGGDSGGGDSGGGDSGDGDSGGGDTGGGDTGGGDTGGGDTGGENTTGGSGSDDGSTGGDTSIESVGSGQDDIEV